MAASTALEFERPASALQTVEGMSAKFDKNQGFKFYYGNAARELAAFLPREEPMVDENSTSAAAPALKEIFSLLDRVDSRITAIETQRRHLSFLITDLKRMVG